MTSPTERAVAAIVRILAVAAVDGADPDHTARQIMAGLTGHGWRHTSALPAAQWKRGYETSPPTVEYHTDPPSPHQGDAVSHQYDPEPPPSVKRLLPPPPPPPPPPGDPAAAGREIVHAIQEYEKSYGPGWRNPGTGETQP